MTEGAAGTTLTVRRSGRRRCVYCGQGCHGRFTCYRHSDLLLLDPHYVAERLPTLADELRQAVRAKGTLRGGGGTPNLRVGQMEPRPAGRFVVRETDGWPIGGRYARRMLSLSVLDSAYCYREVARLNEEDEIARRAGNYRTKHERREALRNRAAGIAAMLEAEHA